MTPLDLAHAAMAADPDANPPRLRFYEALAEGELVILLEAEPEPGAEAVPALFPTEDGTLVLAFDSEERLASFAEGAAPYAALPGRALIELLAARGFGLGLNFGVAPSEFLMPSEAVTWLAEVLQQSAAEIEALPKHLTKPVLPEALLAALDRKLARAGGLADHALLVGADWDEGRRGLLLVFVGAREGAERALAQAAGEALRFSGLDEAGEEVTLDVAFLRPEDAALPRLSALALRFDLPEPEEAQALTRPIPPGMDPEKPPRLR